MRVRRRFLPSWFWIILILGALAAVARPAHAQEHREGPKATVLTHALIGATLVGHFTDISTTMYGIGGHRLREANPALRWAQDRPVAMAVVKGGLATLSADLLLRRHVRHPKSTKVAAALVASAMFYVSYRNAKLDRSLR